MVKVACWSPRSLLCGFAHCTFIKVMIGYSLEKLVVVWVAFIDLYVLTPQVSSAISFCFCTTGSRTSARNHASRHHSTIHSRKENPITSQDAHNWSNLHVIIPSHPSLLLRRSVSPTRTPYLKSYHHRGVKHRTNQPAQKPNTAPKIRPRNRSRPRKFLVSTNETPKINRT